MWEWYYLLSGSIPYGCLSPMSLWLSARPTTYHLPLVWMSFLKMSNSILLKILNIFKSRKPLVSVSNYSSQGSWEGLEMSPDRQSCDYRFATAAHCQICLNRLNVVFSQSILWEHWIFVYFLRYPLKTGKFTFSSCLWSRDWICNSNLYLPTSAPPSLLKKGATLTAQIMDKFC